ncbi:hypothetical protein [Mycobacteroides abscessus]|uniref:hypothetical protein n=1 Tax=Mycobacteroides abscessus TaxID=36809 RepID=UPI00104252EB|nr:hypothetical protein [Mycobacteroides abscessus]
MNIELSRFHGLDDHYMAVGNTSDLIETIAYTLLLRRDNQDLAVLAVKGNPESDTFASLEENSSGVVRPDLSPGARTAWRLGQVLSGEIDRRRKALEQAEVTNISDYQKLNPDHRFPELFVVFDDPTWLLDGDDITEVWQDLQQHGHLLAIRFIIAIPYPEWEGSTPSTSKESPHDSPSDSPVNKPPTYSVPRCLTGHCRRGRHTYSTTTISPFASTQSPLASTTNPAERSPAPRLGK